MRSRTYSSFVNFINSFFLISDGHSYQTAATSHIFSLQQKSNRGILPNQDAVTEGQPYQTATASHAPSLQQDNNRDHIYIPSNLKPTTTEYVHRQPCPVCGLLFPSKEHVQQHLSIHSRVKPYPCVVCGKRFNQKSDVISHQVEHIPLLHNHTFWRI